jgi:hypothetical protein
MKYEAPNFPEGWKFTFQVDADDNNTLYLFGPTGRRYYSVQSAKKQYSTSLQNVDATAFYQYVGIDLGDKNDDIAPEREVDLDRHPSIAASPELPKRLSLNSRCYARYHHNQWYWGWVKEITEGKYFTCAVSTLGLTWHGTDTFATSC